MRRRTCTAALAALATLALPAMAQAQPGGYPSQPIRMIVTFPHNAAQARRFPYMLG